MLNAMLADDLTRPDALGYRTQLLLLFLMLAISPITLAEWAAGFGNSAYYTDDVALFSVTRRLSLTDDPTQPVVDRPNQGGDFVYEPNAELEWSGHNALGKMNLLLNAGGYAFVQQSAFTHGLYEAQLSQTLPTQTKVSLHYNVVPDLFLGKNNFRPANGEETEDDEKLSSHYWSIHLDQPLTNTLSVRLLSRYGVRNYNEPFHHRDTQFWTLGPHLEWAISPDIALLAGYHYEQGYAGHQKASHFPDNISYINHYTSAELKIRWQERLSSVFIFDYEKNKFTSKNVNDEHRGTFENLHQGEIELLYELTGSATLKMGWQQGHRKLTTEARSVKNNNVWLGFDYAF